MIVAEDNFFRNNVIQRLRLENWGIYFTDQETEAKKILRRKKIDVALVCLNGLKRKGLLFLQMIKKIKPFTEVILINSYEQIALSIEGMKMGAFDDFFVPFDIDSLIHRIHDAYQRKKKKEKANKSLRQRYHDIMMAISFAEVGETETARQFLEEKVIQSKLITSKNLDNINKQSRRKK